jgi:hypothetical protein
MKLRTVLAVRYGASLQEGCREVILRDPFEHTTRFEDESRKNYSAKVGTGS